MERKLPYATQFSFFHNFVSNENSKNNAHNDPWKIILIFIYKLVIDLTTCPIGGESRM